MIFQELKEDRSLAACQYFQVCDLGEDVKMRTLALEGDPDRENTRLPGVVVVYKTIEVKVSSLGRQAMGASRAVYECGS